MSNPTRIADRQTTDTSSPMPVDVARDLLAAVRALEARVAVLEDLLASAVLPPDRRMFAGTRVPVDAVISFADAGYSVDQILKEYPSLKKQDVEAVLSELSDAASALSAALRLPTVPDAYGRI